LLPIEKDLRNGEICDFNSDYKKFILNDELRESLNREKDFILNNKPKQHEIALKIRKSDQILSDNVIDFRQSFKHGFKVSFSVFIKNEEDLISDSMIMSLGSKSKLYWGISLFSFHLLSKEDVLQRHPSDDKLKKHFSVNDWNEIMVLFNPNNKTQIQHTINGLLVSEEMIEDFSHLENLISTLSIGKPAQLLFKGDSFEGFISSIVCSTLDIKNRK
jgi:hypothetical protein